MGTEDFFRARLENMIDLRHPLAMLTRRLNWEKIEAALMPLFEHKAKALEWHTLEDLLGQHQVKRGAEVSAAGRPRKAIRLMVSLTYLKHCYNLSDEELVERWSENVVWQYFSGMEYYEPRRPCDATQIGRFRRHLDKDGLEQLLKLTVDTAVEIQAIKPAELERVIVDTTVQEKNIAFPVDSRLLEIARHKVANAAKHMGLRLKQTYAKEGKTLRRRASGYAHARQTRRLKRVLKRQRTILGVLKREVQRKLETARPQSPIALTRLTTLLERAERIRTQQRHDKNKLYALHAPEVECISKGKARQRYEFGVKASLAVTYQQGLMVGAMSCPGNPYDGHTLNGQIEQTNRLIANTGVKVKEAVTDLGYRGVEADNPHIRIVHRGKPSKLTEKEKRCLKRRQAIEPLIGHTKYDHRMSRCFLHGASGDMLNVLCCAAGYNLRWLLRAVVRLGLAVLDFLRLVYASQALQQWGLRLIKRVQTVCSVGVPTKIACATLAPTSVS